MAQDSDAADDTATQMLAAERDALEAEAKVLQTLNEEPQRHRATAEKSLAEARALLSRREAALEEELSRAASLEHALVVESRQVVPVEAPHLAATGERSARP